MQEPELSTTKAGPPQKPWLAALLGVFVAGAICAVALLKLAPTPTAAQPVLASVRVAVTENVTAENAGVEETQDEGDNVEQTNMEAKDAEAKDADEESTPLITERRVVSLTDYDPKIQAAVAAIYGDNTNGAPESDARYYYNTVDLNGDGKLEALVYVTGSEVCGSGGCQLLVLQKVAGRYRTLAEISLAHNPIVVSAHQTRGWHDLFLWVSGGNPEPGYNAVLPFDGKTYADNPSVEPAFRLKSAVRGVAYIADADDAMEQGGFTVNDRD